jgi:hypothetical protein
MTTEQNSIDDYLEKRVENPEWVEIINKIIDKVEKEKEEKSKKE